jgi:hypothetical protein
MLCMTSSAQNKKSDRKEKESGKCEAACRIRLVLAQGMCAANAFKLEPLSALWPGSTFQGYTGLNRTSECKPTNLKKDSSDSMAPPCAGNVRCRES